jgi:hypothetical protein
MTVQLLLPYATFAIGASVDLDNATEAALVAQRRAVYVGTSPGPIFMPLTPNETQTLRDALATGSFGSGGIFTAIPVTATATGQRQAIGPSRSIQLTAPTPGNVRIKFTDASAAIGVSNSSDTYIAATATISSPISVPSGAAFLEYIRDTAQGSNVTLTLSLLS